MDKLMKYLSFDSPIGKLTVAAIDGAVVNVFFDGEEPAGISDSPDNAVLQMAATQLREYFDGRRKVFDVPLKPKGGKFFQTVWQIMTDDVHLPFGKTVSYSELAALAGSPRACRAVGMANNKNPIPIFIPCHRVLGRRGSLTGFRWGLSVKEKLLDLEGITR